MNSDLYMYSDKNETLSHKRCTMFKNFEISMEIEYLLQGNKCSICHTGMFKTLMLQY